MMKMLVLAVLLGAALAQLDVGVLSALYYPPPARAAPPTRTPAPPRAARRVLRSDTDCDAAPADGNDADLCRFKHEMADPNWTPQVGPRPGRDAGNARHAAHKFARLY